MIKLETNKERVVRELRAFGYDLGMTAEEAVEQFTHIPEVKGSFDETETISYFSKGEVDISLTGLDILSQQAVEENLALFANEVLNDVHTCLKEVIHEYAR